MRDITRPMSANTPIWQGDTPVSVQKAVTSMPGVEVTTSSVSLGSHAGTHVDAPGHIFPGATTVDQLELQRLVGRAAVIDCRGHAEIDADCLAVKVPAGSQRILIIEDEPQITGDLIVSTIPLTMDAAGWLLDNQIELVGLSGPSVDRFDSSDLSVHKTLLAAGVVIIENLALSEVPAGNYCLVCLPLNLVGADGAPSRVILLDV
ncbi:MAG: cyclase family protein [Anaerolineae bacterium]